MAMLHNYLPILQDFAIEKILKYKNWQVYKKVDNWIDLGIDNNTCKRRHTCRWWTCRILATKYYGSFKCRPSPIFVLTSTRQVAFWCVPRQIAFRWFHDKLRSGLVGSRTCCVLVGPTASFVLEHDELRSGGPRCRPTGGRGSSTWRPAFLLKMADGHGWNSLGQGVLW